MHYTLHAWQNLCVFSGCRQDYFIFYIQPLNMELIEGSETSENHNRMPGKYPKEYIQDYLLSQWYCLWPFGKVVHSTEDRLVTFTSGFILPGDISHIPSSILPFAQVSFSLVLTWYIDRTVKCLYTSRCIIHLRVFLTLA